MKLFKVLCLTQNAKLIQFLDEISILKVCYAEQDIFLNLEDFFHFIILDQQSLDKIFNKNIQNINKFLNKIKDFSGESFFIIFSEIEKLDQFLNNHIIDDFITNPFAPHLTHRRLSLMYNKKIWLKNEHDVFNFCEEVDILLEEIDISLNRMQMYFYNSKDGIDYIKKENDNIIAPSGFIISFKKIQCILSIFYAIMSNYIKINNFNKMIKDTKEILQLYNVNLNLIFQETFTFHSLSPETQKYLFISLALLMLSATIESEMINIEILNEDKKVKIKMNKNILSNNLFSSIVLFKISKKIKNINIHENNIEIF